MNTKLYLQYQEKISSITSKQDAGAVLKELRALPEGNDKNALFNYFALMMANLPKEEINENKNLNEEESDTADQAHKLGLTAAGWGYWADASGKKVARTIQGHLVKLTDDEKDAINNPINKQSTSQQPETEPLKPTVNTVPYYDPSFYESSFDDLKEQAENIVKHLSKSGDLKYIQKTVEDFIKNMFNVSPDITYIGAEASAMYIDHITSLTDDISPTTTVNGLYEPKQHRIYNRNYDSTLQFFSGQNNLIPTLEEGQNAAKMYIENELNDKDADLELELTEIISNTINTFHTMIHETIHAKDLFLEKRKGSRYEKYNMFLIEGLTEYKTKQLCWQMLSNTKIPDSLKYIDCFFYDNETDFIDTMEKINPGISTKLWAETNSQARLNILHKTIQSSILQRLEYFKSIISNPKRINAWINEVKTTDFGKRLRTDAERWWFKRLFDNNLQEHDLVTAMINLLNI